MYKNAFKLALLATVATVAHAESDDDYGEPDGTEYEDNKVWMATDFSLGLAMGLYAPISTVAYGGSCFNTWYNFATSQVKWHKFFDSEFEFHMDLHGAILIFEFLHLGYEIYEIAHICGAQYDDLEENEFLEWNSHYATASTPTVKEGSDAMHYVHLGMITTATLVHAYEAFEYWEDKYYWMLLGIDLGKAVAHIPALTQEYDLAHIFDEYPQYVRFYRDHDDDDH